MKLAERKILPEGPAAGTLRDTSVSHIGLRTPDPAAVARFYQRVLGLVPHETLADGGIRLGWGTGHHVLDLLPGDHGLDHYAFEVRDPGGLAGIAERLTRAGVAFDDLGRSFVDAPAGPPAGIVVCDPDGTPVHFHTEVDRPGEQVVDAARRPIRFQHTTLGTTDTAPLVAFYTGVVGFALSDQLDDGGFCWMRSDHDHHTLAVLAVGTRAVLDHYSFDVARWDDFKVWCDRLTDLGVDVQWGPGRHGPGNNLFLFLNDPSGNRIELSAEMEKFRSGVEYAPRRWQPTADSVNLWGGQTPRWRHLDSGTG